MLKYKDNKFTKLDQSDLKSNGLFERYNLQETIINSWDEFIREIKMPDLILIGQEVVPDERVKGRIDILAYDQNDDVPVVIELKRDKDKLQLLQGISYAAMISNWDSDRFIEEAKNQKTANIEEVNEVVSGKSIEKNVRIILVAEKFDPEVIISTDWLLKNYNLDISAVSISIFRSNTDLYFSFEQKYPLKELHESYELRSKTRQSSTKLKEKTWADIKTLIEYSWGSELIDQCVKIMPGDPSRSRFIHIKKKVGEIGKISLMFRKKYLNIYMWAEIDEPEAYFKDLFPDHIDFREWKNGYSVLITDTRDYEKLKIWLNLKEED